MTDEALMREALAEAGLAAAEGEVPVGAVVADAEGIIARGRNQREVLADPTAHAEIVALRRAGEARGFWRLEGTTLCVTLEPCAMCAGALVNARVERLVYGCRDPKAGAVDSLYRICGDARLNHRLEVISGVLQDECARLLQEFFARLRAGDGPAKPRP